MLARGISNISVQNIASYATMNSHSVTINVDRDLAE